MGWPRSAGTPVLEQPRPAAHRVSVGRRRRAPRALGEGAEDAAAPAPRHALRLHWRRLGTTNHPFESLAEIVDIESIGFVNQPLEEGRDPAEVLEAVRKPAAATTPAPRCSGATPRTPGSPPAPRGCRSTPTTSRSTQPRRSTTRSRSSRTTRRSSRCAMTSPRSSMGDFTVLVPEDPQVYAFTRRLDATELRVLVKVSSEQATVAIDDAEASGSRRTARRRKRGRARRPLTTRRPRRGPAPRHAGSWRPDASARRLRPTASHAGSGCIFSRRISRPSRAARSASRTRCCIARAASSSS